jgi:hypothetical protein
VSGINYDKEYARRPWCLDEEIKLKRSMGRGQLKVSLLNEGMSLNEGDDLPACIGPKMYSWQRDGKSRSYVEFNRMVMNCTRCGRWWDRLVS